MAVFIGRAAHGSDFYPLGVRQVFDDVPPSYWAAAWIGQFMDDGITGGCSSEPPLYCPESLVSRSQMAIFLLRSRHGAYYEPPPATGERFSDVPKGHWAAAWIEQLAKENITGGCTTERFCPSASVTRAQMAVFLVRTFGF